MEPSDPSPRPRVGTAVPAPPRAVGAAEHLPQVIRVFDALDAWCRDPGTDVTASLTAALDAILEATGVRGLVLEICAPPMPTLELGAGSMRPLPERADRTGLAAHPLQARAGHGTLGRLLLDAPGPEAPLLVRVLELAVDTAWSSAEIRVRAERLMALEAATRAVAAELDIDRVLQLIVDRVRDLVGARYAALGTADSRGRIDRFITAGISPEDRAAIGAAPSGLGLLGLVIREARTIRADDIARHEARYGFPPSHPPMSSFLGAPVVVKGRSVGNLYLTDKPNGEAFTEDDERLVEMFAAHAGIAIENARLHDQVQRLAIIEERERIGKDLHDGIIQSIYAVGLSLEDVPDLVEDETGRADAVARIDRAIDALNLAIADIRSYILRLRPALGGDDDPVEALARLGEEFGIHAVVDLETDLERGAAGLRRLAPDRRSDLLFIAREALSNVARHAGASRASLSLAQDGHGGLVLCVEDNGRGFDPGLVAGPDALGRHQGLANMRARAVAMGGSFTVDRPDGSGARIIVRVPEPSDPPLTGAGDQRP